MKRLFSLACIIFLSLPGISFADTIYLKNGKHMSGIIAREDSDSVELAVGFGTVKFYNYQIKRITRSSEEESQALADSWSTQRTQATSGAQEDTSLNPRNEIKATRLGDHLLVNAVINAKAKARLLVDTGASVVMLSKAKAKELGIEVKSEEKSDAKLKLADGSEAEGKLVELKSVALDNARARDVAAAVIMNDAFFKDFDGLLGMSYLKLFKFEIDLPGSKLILQEPVEAEEKPTKR